MYIIKDKTKEEMAIFWKERRAIVEAKPKDRDSLENQPFYKEFEEAEERKENLSVNETTYIDYYSWLTTSRPSEMFEMGIGTGNPMNRKPNFLVVKEGDSLQYKHIKIVVVLDRQNEPI